MTDGTEHPRDAAPIARAAIANSRLPIAASRIALQHSDDLLYWPPQPAAVAYLLRQARLWPRCAAAAHDEHGQRLPHMERVPTFDSLRHSHVASLIADGFNFAAVQRRLGNIGGTDDTYGHLNDSVDEQVLAGLQRGGERLMLPASGDT